jgi:tRNA G18 (ribose-2'-O)-methylase SpoU
LILLEGKILIEEALKWPNVQLSHLFYTSKQKIDQLKLNLKEKERLLGGKVILHATNEFLINKWSHLQTNQGLLAVAKLKKEEIRNSSPSLPLTLVLDNIRDPGKIKAT